MKEKFTSIIALASLLLSFSAYTQENNVIGFWKVASVAVGDENMTPVAKWFRINANGLYQTGNGWLQNGQGNWFYDIENNIYSSTDSLDVADEFGGFKVSFQKEKMLWEREEEGMQVKVSLLPIKELPMSPADYLEGIWDLVEITENEESIIHDFDADNRHKLFIRWDRIYINFSTEGERLTGYWHIHGHKPEITLLPHQESKKPESWKIEVNKKELLLMGISDSNRTMQRKYVRKSTF